MAIGKAEERVEAGNSPFWRRRQWVLALVLVLLVGAGLGYGLQALQVLGAGSADVGFARDMSEHHRQAVEMSRLLYDRTDDELMRTLAYDIMMTQQAQIGMMSAWLESWGHSWGAPGPRMAWMGMPVSGLMPGMATREELNRLADTEGVEADALFMELMIHHHRSGVMMAQAAVEQAQSEMVRDLAQAMVEGQAFEIDYMQEMLQEKGYEPVPATEMSMSHE